MKLTHEEFRARLTDYLYGELAEDERRAVEACLAESESCRSELSALQETLGVMRAALRGPLAEAPPRSVQRAVLAAAEEHARLMRARPTRSRGASLLRTPWLFPALGAAAALALVVFGNTAERDHEGSEAPVREAPVRQAPADEPQASFREGERPLPSAPRLSDEANRASEQGTAGSAPEGDHASPPGAPAGGVASSAPGAVPAPAPMRERAAKAARRSPGGGAAAGRAAADDTPRASADPPVSMGVGAERRASGDTAAATEPRTARPRTASGVEGDDFAAPPRAATQRFAVPPAAEPAVPPAAEPAAAPAESRALGPEPDARAEAAADAAGGPLPLEELARRAREQLAAARYRSAEASYRELLRRFPRDARSRDWRRALDRAREAARAASDGAR